MSLFTTGTSVASSRKSANEPKTALSAFATFSWAFFSSRFYLTGATACYHCTGPSEAAFVSDLPTATEIAEMVPV